MKHLSLNSSIFGILLLLLLHIQTSAQKKPKDSKSSIPTLPAAPPATPTPSTKTGIKPYKEVITAKAKSNKGLFIVHKVDEKYYLNSSAMLEGFSEEDEDGNATGSEEDSSTDSTSEEY